MALSRSRRSNAGSKMAMLLNTMESDEFYTTTYGGFNEEDADVDFICEAAPVTASTTADVDDDIVDSDFSIDENDEPRSDVENEDDPDRPKRAKRGLGVQTKAYKEPKRDQVLVLLHFVDFQTRYNKKHLHMAGNPH
jgi:vacuolar protein sorting-associated protein 72